MTDEPIARSRRNLLLTAALFSTGGVAIKAVNLAGPQVACLRSGIAAVALMIFLPEARRNWNPRVCLLASVYALTLVCFVIANKLTTSANAIFLQDTAPLYILVLSAILLHERPRRADLWFMLVLACGLSLFFAGAEHPRDTATNPPLGNLFGAASGVFYAIVIVGFRWLSRGGDASGSLSVTGLGNLLAFVFCLPFAWPLAPGRPLDWAVLIYLGVFQIALAYLIMTRSMRHVSAVEASLLLLLEPVLNPVWTWMVYRERPANFALLGGALILGATVVRSLSQRRRMEA